MPVFVVHGRMQALALRRLCPLVEILIPRHVTITGGPAFVHYLIQDLDPPPWVDCADHRGHALGLLRMGIPRLIFDGPPAIFDKLASIGAQAQTLVLQELTAPCKWLKPDELADKVLVVRLQEAGFEV